MTERLKGDRLINCLVADKDSTFKLTVAILTAVLSCFSMSRMSSKAGSQPRQVSALGTDSAEINLALTCSARPRRSQFLTVQRCGIRPMRVMISRRHKSFAARDCGTVG